MEEMKLWAELTMSLQKVETKSNMENDGTFSSRLCRGTSCHRLVTLSPTLADNIPPRGHGRAEPDARVWGSGCFSQGWGCAGLVVRLQEGPQGHGPQSHHPAAGPSGSPSAAPRSHQLFKQ